MALNDTTVTHVDGRLWAMTKGVRGRIGSTVAVGIISTVVGVVRLALLGWLLGQVFRGIPLVDLLPGFFGVAAIMIIRAGLEYWRQLIAHETAAKVQRSLRQKIFNKVCDLGPGWFGLRRTGGVITTMVEGVEQLEIYFGEYLPHLAVSLLTPFIIFTFVAFLDFDIATIFLVFALLTMFGPLLLKHWDRRAQEFRKTAYADFAAEFLDSIQGLATLKAFGQSTARGAFLAEKAHAVFRATMGVLLTSQAQRGIADASIAIGAALAIAIGAYKVSAETLPMIHLLMILLMGVEVFRPLRELRDLAHKGLVGQAAAQALFELFDAKSLIDDVPPAPEPLELEPSVAFKGVYFSYPGGNRGAHSDMNFVVPAGKRIAFVGSSGAGKSTISKLLLRFHDPDQGQVTIGDRDLRDMSFSQIRQRMAVLSQDTYLFHGTVEDNLRFGKQDASSEEIDAAVRAANAHEFITDLPNGYDTIIGERGVRLSGGQRQRIAIARALLRNAPILVLDEALSSVDAENEAVILEALDRLMRGRTVLIFAHRLSSVIGADCIMVVDEGQIVESGTHDELIELKGAYQRLMGTQIREPGGVSVIDPVSKQKNSIDEVEGDLPGYDPNRPMEQSDSILRAEGLGWLGLIAYLMRLAQPWAGQLTLTFVLGVARVAAFIGVGAVSALIVANLRQGEPFQDLLVWLAITAPLAGILHWLESWQAHDMAFRLLAQMRIDLFNKLDKLAPAYLLRRRTGDLVAMATHDVEMVEYFFAHTITPAFVAILVPAIVIALEVWFGWLLAIALIPFLAFVGLSPFLARKRVDRLGSKAREALGLLNAHASDTIQGLAEIIAFQREDIRADEFDKITSHHHVIRLPFLRDMSLQAVAVEAATGLGGLAVVLAGATMVQAGELERAFLPLLTMLAMAAFLPVSEISNIGRQLADTLGSTRRLFAVHEEPVLIEDGPGVDLVGKTNSGVSLSLEDVSFAYHGTAQRALANVTFEVPPGKTLALVGSSGAGKTTVAHMLLRFWDPIIGRVLMAGHDLCEFKQEALRQQIALVTQDTYLFNTTLGENIRMARPDASDAEVVEAVRRSALESMVKDMPEGLDTRVGERGMRLSGGQRQRVAIARAFLKDAPVLILDEATSHLDAVNEALVHNALENLMADRTTIVIAHRLSTVRGADCIVVLDTGRVMDIGTHAELISRRGIYARLVARQMGKAAGE